LKEIILISLINLTDIPENIQNVIEGYGQLPYSEIMHIDWEDYYKENDLMIPFYDWLVLEYGEEIKKHNYFAIDSPI